MARRAEPAGPRDGPRRERVAAFRLGLSAESRAAMCLIAKGHRIVARRWKTLPGEVDIVARRRRALVFVEVKARAHADDAAEAGPSVVSAASSRRLNSGSPTIRTMRNAKSASTSCWSRPAKSRNTSPTPSMRRVK
jgi:Holliday junction resolvase-like predicted endonuclease